MILIPISSIFFLSTAFVIIIGSRARYGVQLESGPFQRRTADFLWMILFGALSLLVCIRLSVGVHVRVTEYCAVVFLQWKLVEHDFYCICTSINFFWHPSLFWLIMTCNGYIDVHRNLFETSSQISFYERIFLKVKLNGLMILI